MLRENRKKKSVIKENSSKHSVYRNLFLSIQQKWMDIADVDFDVF